MSLKINLSACCCLLLTTFTLSAQSTNKNAGKLTSAAFERIKTGEDTLALLAYAVVNDSIEKERFAACRALIPALVRTLKVENSFRYQFDRLKSVSILAPPDSSFRVFTWQLFVNDSTYRYYGAIQMNSGELKLFPFIDRSFEFEDRPVSEQLAPDRWYGALYYNIRQFDTKEGRKYLLFGFDAYEFFNKRKVIEVLSFDKTGKPVFGAPVFDRTDAKVAEHRLLLEYSAEASVRVNWDEQYQMVLFDHLITVPSPFGRGFTNVPDGSYDGLRFEKGRWKYIDKVFNDVMSEAPFPEPVLDNRKDKDLMGREKKKKKAKGERP
ncbi:MAG: hypothetical protein KA165_02700 [Saprospiraceae bacterium]|nr:hypothetical protein [Saprospiraceae bacterium]